MSSVLGIRADALTAWRALQDAIADAGRPTPCRAEPDVWADPATAELAATAAALCTRCPVLTECRTFADLNHERAGVYGGQLRTPKRGRPAVEQKETA